MDTTPPASTACVTGATGFVGASVATALHDAGWWVRATYRDRPRLQALEGLQLEPVRADVLDRASLRRAMRGCEVLFHVAGVVGARPAERIFEVNALGPEIAVEAAAAEGVRRVVLTSTVGAIGPSRPGEVADEEQPFDLRGLRLTYHEAKHEGEARALAAAARTGVELVIVNPSYVLGAPETRGVGAESSIRIVANYLRGRLPAIADSWTNIVDVGDVAAGHLLALEHGEPGERYILGGTDIRWPALLRRLGELAGVDHPFLVIPKAAARPAELARTLRLPTPISPEAISLMALDHRHSSAKAERELGYRHRDLDETLRESIRWFAEAVEDESFPALDLSTMRFMAEAVRAANRIGILPAARIFPGSVGRIAGRA